MKSSVSEILCRLGFLAIMLVAAMAAPAVSAADVDTDRDGMPNTWEIEHGLNPMSSLDGDQDSDGDGLPDYGEWVIGSDPAGADSPAKLYVNAATGSDATGDGSMALPYATITKAASAITTAPLMVKLAAGTYPEKLTMRTRLAIIGASDASTTITAQGSGRTIFIPAEARVVLKDISVTGGSTTSGGGGIYTSGGAAVLYLNHAEVVCNTASYGGGVYFYGLLLRAVGCVFQNNATVSTSSTYGGGLCVTVQSGGSIMIYNSLIAGNTATMGGGIYASGFLDIAHSTFANNAVYGLYCSGISGAMRNSILSGNGIDYYANSGSIVLDRNCIRDGSGGAQMALNISADPGFLCEKSGDFRISPDSPCVDAGDGGHATPFDYFGLPRWDCPATADTGTSTPAYADLGYHEMYNTDGDGLEDSWEIQYFGNLFHDGSADNDADGLTNLEEVGAGTNPKQADTDGDGLFDADELYADGTRGDTDGYVTDPLNPDTDADGLNDGQEHSNLSNPTVSDTDGDGLNDGYEAANGLNPTSNADSDSDADGDGLPNYGEWVLGTDPQGADSPARVYVDPKTGSDAIGTGAQAYPWATIRRALSATSTTAQISIRIAPGTCRERVTLRGGVALIGSAGTSISAESSGRPLTINGPGAAIVLKTLRVTGGSTSTLGAGLYASASGAANKLYLYEIDFLNNRSTSSSGGGMEISNSSLRAVRCGFRHNSSATTGGGFRLVNANATINDCIVANNASSYGRDGADVSGGSFVANNCTFANNDGEGLFLTSSLATVRNSILWGNRDNIGLVTGTAILERNCIEDRDATATWQVTASEQYAGSYCARSFPIGHNQSSSLQFTRSVAAGHVSFYYKVSSESGYDYLRFYIDGVLMGGGKSGTIGWSALSIPITAGTHTFTWTYSKDGTVSSGSDCAWIDNITMPDGSMEGFESGNLLAWDWHIPTGISIDPRFINPAGGDYRLRPGSPCVDIADGNHASLIDLAGNTRWDDPATTNTGTGSPNYADIGCYEMRDTDADQMEDAWEVAMFGDLSHDGSADTDDDGFTDLQEFQMATNPNAANTRVISITRADANPTSASAVRFTVTFNRPVTGVDRTDFATSVTGVTGSVATVTGSGAIYTVTVNVGSGSGRLRLNLNDNDTIIDQLGIPLGGAGVNGSFNSGEVYTIDNAAPAPGTASSPTYATTSPIQVNYSGAGDSGSGLRHIELWYKLGSGAWTDSGLRGNSASGTFTFDAAHGLGANGTYYFDLVAVDLMGNRSATPSSSSGDDNTIYDATPPVPGTATPPATATVSPITIPYTGASDAGSGLKKVELWYSKDGGAWTNSGLYSSSASNYFYFYSSNGLSGPGIYQFDLVAEDYAGNRSAPAAFPGDGMTLYNTTAPRVNSITRTDVNPTTATTVHFKVVFNLPVTGVDAADFMVVATGLTAAAVSSVDAAGTISTVTVNVGSGDGTLRLDLVDNDTIVDGPGVPLGGIGVNGSFTTGESYTIDRTPPTPGTATPPAACTTSSFSIPFSGASDAGSGLRRVELWYSKDDGPWTYLANSPSASGTFTSSSSSLGGDGSYRFDLVAEDGAGNRSAPAASPGDGITIWDLTTPSVKSITLFDASPTSASTVRFLITFSEPVTGVDASDFSPLMGAGLSGATLFGHADGPTTWTITASTGTGSGSLTLSQQSSGTEIMDLVGNPLYSNWYSRESYTIDRAAPAVSSITRLNPTSSLTNLRAVSWQIKFTEEVRASTLNMNDFTLTKLNGADPIAGYHISNVVQTDTKTFFVTVNPGTGEGTLRLDVPASATILDNLGNCLNTAYVKGETYKFDLTPPVGTVALMYNAEYTTSLNVAASFNATDASGMNAYRLSNDGKTWASWKAYQSPVSWTFTGGDSVKTVYAQFRDLAMNVSSTVSDSIVYVSRTDDYSKKNAELTSYLLGLSNDPTGLDVNADDKVNIADLVHNTGLLPPDTPASPSPADKGVNVAVTSNLGWADDVHATGYDVYLWKMIAVKPTTPTALVTTNQYDPPATLSYGTTYWWQVVAKGKTMNVAGPTWSFTTKPQVVQVITPNGGETWTRGATAQIHWKFDKVTAGTSARFELWRNGARVKTLGTGYSSTGEATTTITVPSDVAAAGNYVVRVISAWLETHGGGPDSWDESDAMITIK